MPPLPGESSERGPALGEVVRRGHRRAVSGPRAPAPMAKARVHHRAPPARLAHREGEIPVVAVEEPVRLIEPAHQLQNCPRQEEAHPVHRRHLGDRRPRRGLPLEGVDDGPPHVAPIAAQPPHPVEAGQAHAPGTVDRGLQALEPTRLAHHGVVVQEAEAVAAGQPGPLVERTDEPHVVRVAVVAQRGPRGPLPEEALGAVGGAVVDDAQLEETGGGPQALEAGAGEGELVVEDEDDAGGHWATGPTVSRAGGGPPPRRWPRPAGYRSASGTYLRSIAPV